MARLRCITNYLTRMRLTNAEGVWSLSLRMHWMRRCQQAFSRGLSLIVRLQNSSNYFGHWAALQGKTISPPKFKMSMVDVFGATTGGLSFRRSTVVCSG